MSAIRPGATSEVRANPCSTAIIGQLHGPELALHLHLTVLGGVLDRDGDAVDRCRSHSPEACHVQTATPTVRRRGEPDGAHASR